MKHKDFNHNKMIVKKEFVTQSINQACDEDENNIDSFLI